MTQQRHDGWPMCNRLMIQDPQMQILTTARLRLRTMTGDDAAFYLALLNQSSYHRHIGDRGLRSVAAAREALAQGPCALQQRLGFSLYLVERRSDGAALGMCGLIKRDSLADVDLGYAMLDAHAGQGYLYEAAVAVRDHGRNALGLRRLLGVTGPDNGASNHILRKLGMQLTGSITLRPDDGRVNLYCIEFCPLRSAALLL